MFDRVRRVTAAAGLGLLLAAGTLPSTAGRCTSVTADVGMDDEKGNNSDHADWTGTKITCGLSRRHPR